MKKLIILTLLLLSFNVFAEIGYVSIKMKRPTGTIFFGRYNDQKLIEGLNKRLYDACIQAGAKKIDFISYTNIQSLVRDKNSGDLYATAWFEK